jgi:complex iron-sulfur molybdoenzyme family reductase subunit gamma
MHLHAPPLLAAALLLAAAPARGDDAFLRAEAIEVRELPAPLPADPAAPAWEGIPATPVPAAPQRSIRLHDRETNRALERAVPRALRVRAATDGADLALLLEWDDAAEDLARPDATDAYGDAAAVQLPLRFGAGVRLPYVGMGDEGERVALYLARAGAEGTRLRQAVAAGFGSATRAELGEARAAMRYDPARRAWRALLVRPLAIPGHDLRRGLVPVAFAVWDGAARERGGNKALTAWKFLRLARHAVDPAWLAELSWGYGAAGGGDVGRGRALVEGQCTACHAVSGPAAVPGLAPDLSGIGLVASPGYLRDSIVSPGAVLVPGPNPRQHQDRTKGADARGAYPPDPGYTWFVREADGRRVSTMPDYSAMPPQEVADAVAYLRTLGAAPTAAGRKP